MTYISLFTSVALYLLIIGFKYSRIKNLCTLYIGTIKMLSTYFTTEWTKSQQSYYKAANYRNIIKNITQRSDIHYFEGLICGWIKLKTDLPARKREKNNKPTNTYSNFYFHYTFDNRGQLRNFKFFTHTIIFTQRMY